MPRKAQMRIDNMNWTDLNKFLQECDEQGAVDALKHEKKNKQRAQFMMRIHARFNKLRGQREKRELIGEKV
jgi:hypothetical protein